ncbi:hypothetical protein UFOVP121_5 [uncultured Caudovirales phage]|uniref:Uncharacterized protein n=1 Tax=uncultured Caudovirales phage TaxID=2100421 RepID=A0A6J5LC21_9CAUD|nr:hypothetical protein UFOVP121_5 [uncultured Caudovirales phage]CAB4134756.1 hypothetical protein UFOVP277_10 [uncultured Caudovirales phage]
MAYVTAEVELDEFDLEDMAKHLQANGYEVFERNTNRPQDELLSKMYELYRNNKPIDEHLRKLFYTTLGRIG